MQKFSILNKFWRGVASVLFLLLGLLQYFFYYYGLTELFHDILTPIWIILAILVTYMFRIDALAATIGFYGAWHVLNVPKWEAIFISAIFLVLSVFVNHSAGLRVIDYFKKPNEKNDSAIFDTEKDDGATEDPPTMANAPPAKTSAEGTKP